MADVLRGIPWVCTVCNEWFNFSCAVCIPVGRLSGKGLLERCCASSMHDFFLLCIGAHTLGKKTATDPPALSDIIIIPNLSAPRAPNPGYRIDGAC